MGKWEWMGMILDFRDRDHCLHPWLHRSIRVPDLGEGILLPWTKSGVRVRSGRIKGIS